MTQIATFPFTFVGNSKLGKIYRPYAVIEVFSKTRNKWQPLEVIVDTGADYSLFPKRHAAILGIDLEKECYIEKTLGIGGRELVYQYKNLPIKVGKWQSQVPVGFLNRDDIPSLLGRLACLEVFRLIFEEKKSIFET